MLLLLAACTPSGSGIVPSRTSDDAPPPPDPTTPVDTETVAPTADTGATATASTGETAAPDPCLTLSPVVLASQRVSDVPRSEEFAFDPAGNVLAAIESSGVFVTTFAGDRTLLSPGSSWEYAGARMSPDGLSLTLCDEAGGTVSAIDLATGSRTDLVALAGPNTIGWDRWGRLWIGANESLYRWDPTTGGGPELITSVPGADLDGITFAPGDTTVYFNDDSGGAIGAVSLDASGEVTGIGAYAALPGVGGWAGVELDGMTTDVCGNLYVVQTNGKLSRILLDGTVQTLLPTSGHYTTAVNFGSGLGGWERSRLYVMDRNDGLWELDLGIEGRPEAWMTP